MLKNIIKQAENLGTTIAKSTSQDKTKRKEAFNDFLGLKTQSPQPEKSPEGKVIYWIKPFRENDLGISYWHSFLKNFTKISEEISFVISGNRMDMRMYAIIPASLKNYFENVFYSGFPTSELDLVTNLSILSDVSYINYDEKVEVALDANFVKNGTYHDPLKDVLSLYENVEKDDTLQLVYTYKSSIPQGFREKFFEFLRKLFVRANSEQKGDETKAKPELKVETFMSVGFAFKINDKYTADNIKSNLKSVFSKFVVEGKSEIMSTPKFKGLNLNQAINFFHLPTSDYFIKSLSYSVYRKLPYPTNLATLENSEKNDLTLIGTTDYKSDKIKFGIRKEDKFRHMYVVGKSGTGKSTILSNFIKSDMMTGKGLALVDPHGDLVETVMEHIPSYRINDVILFDVADMEFPIGFNVLQYSSPDEKNLIVSGVVGTFKKLFDNSRGPRLEYILRNVMLAVVEYPNATLQHILRILIEKNFREEVLSHVTDAVVLKFRRQEYDVWTDKFRDEAIAPITNKVGQFLSAPIVRNIFGQPASKLNIRKCMDEGKILLINLSKGKIGEDNAEMIGSFLVTKFQIDAMARADTPFKDRRDFYLYIDEFQNFATDSFAVILSEARKYKLSLIVANQYTSQLDEKIRDAIFGNVGTIISFTLGYDDAQVMALQFKELVTPNDFLSLPRFKAYVKLMTDGIISDPFSMSTLPLTSPENYEELREKVKKQSRQRYGIEKEKLEELLKARNAKTFSLQEKIMEKARAEGQAPAQNQTTPPVTNTTTTSTQVKNSIPAQTKNFSIDDIKIGDMYDGYVKLKYNYGLFITVKGVEGLLHKNFVKAPDGINRKDFFNIGDKITVKADSFKDINGEKRVVWIM
ncbi:MAG TPA: DUF87 domain-containing protein [Candidatus Absconditabacterales bacterium]|nr:DUF87 domain-containing protein [Candidatus Absconditabacterales bacterium]